MTFDVRRVLHGNGRTDILFKSIWNIYQDGPHCGSSVNLKGLKLLKVCSSTTVELEIKVDSLWKAPNVCKLNNALLNGHG